MESLALLVLASSRLLLLRLKRLPRRAGLLLRLRFGEWGRTVWLMLLQHWLRPASCPVVVVPLQCGMGAEPWRPTFLP